MTWPRSLLTPSISITLQLLAEIVIAMPLRPHDKSWHVDRVLAAAITHSARPGPLTYRCQPAPDPPTGEWKRSKGQGRDEEVTAPVGEKRRRGPLPSFLSWSQSLPAIAGNHGGKKKHSHQLIKANEVEPGRRAAAVLCGALYRRTRRPLETSR